MSKTGYELFLIELYPISVTIPSMKAISKQILPVKTVLSFKILDLPGFDIVHNDKVDNCMCQEYDTQEFNNGKSSLFALESHLTQSPEISFPMTVTVKKLMPFNTLPNVIVIGTRVIELNCLINKIFDDLRNCIKKPSRSLENNFKIETDTCQKVGEVKMVIRLSHLGSKVVTQFTMPNENSPYLFKAMANSPIMECKTVPVCNEPSNVILDCKGDILTQDNQKPKLCWSPSYKNIKADQCNPNLNTKFDLNECINQENEDQCTCDTFNFINQAKRC